MVKLIKRKTDNKYLVSIETDSWTDNIKDASIMTYRECKAAIEDLIKTYQADQIEELIDFKRNKQMSEEEVQELKDLLNKRN